MKSFSVRALKVVVILLVVLFFRSANILGANENIKIESKHLKRVFKDASKGFVTVEYKAIDSSVDLIDYSTSNEGSVTLNGKEYKLGGNAANSLPYLGHTVTGMGEKGGQKLEVCFGAVEDLPEGLLVKAIYKAPDISPVLIKMIRIDNESDFAVKLNHITVEGFTPKTDSKKAALLLESDYVRDAVKVNGKSIYFPFIEHHNHYVDAFLNTKSEPTEWSYPVEISRWLAVGDRFNSFNAYEFIASNKNLERRGVDFRKATRTLFPWTANKYLSCSTPITKNSPEDIKNYRRSIAAAAEAGFDSIELWSRSIKGKTVSPLFANFNDYELNPNLFPNGMSDLRELTDFAKEKGIKISFYSLYSQTWQGKYGRGPMAYRDNNWELQWPSDHYEEHKDTPERPTGGLRWGQALDPGTDWGLFINRKMEDVIIKGGFTAWNLDGPYYGDVSVADYMRGCPAGGPNQVLGWERQTAFYQAMHAMGIEGESPQGFQCFPHGVSRITTTGYDEGDFTQKGIFAQVLSTRLGAYNFTLVYRPEQSRAFVPVTAGYDGKGPSMEPMEDDENLAEYDAYLANCYGYGFEGNIFFTVPYDGPKSKAVFERWFGFWNDHEDFFKKGYLLHLREPDGNNIDGIVHVLEEGDKPRALVVVYNPTKKELTDTLDLGVFEDVDFPLKGWVATAESGKTEKIKSGRITVTVPANSAAWYEMEIVK